MVLSKSRVVLLIYAASETTYDVTFELRVCEWLRMSNFDIARLVLANRKRGMLLSYRGFLFAKNRSRKDKSYWRCVDNTCSVFLHANVFPQQPNANINVLKEPQPHNHPPCDASIARRDMLQQMINVVQADPCGAVLSAYNSVTANASLMPDAVPAFGAVEFVASQTHGMFPRRSE